MPFIMTEGHKLLLRTAIDIQMKAFKQVLKDEYCFDESMFQEIEEKAMYQVDLLLAEYYTNKRKG